MYLNNSSAAEEAAAATTFERFQVQTGRIAGNNVNEIQPHHRCECGDFVGKDVVVVGGGVIYSGDNKNNPLAVQ